VRETLLDIPKPPVAGGAGSVLIVGGGLLGGAIARIASAEGARVIVTSRTPKPHAGLWRLLEPDKPLGAKGAAVFITLGPRPREGVDVWSVALPKLVTAAWREGATRVVVCGPAGTGEAGVDAFSKGLGQLPGGTRTAVARFGPLYGADDACVWPMLRALRESGVARFPRGLPALRLLHVDDAARAAWRAEKGDRVLFGPERLTSAQVGDAMVRRFGGRWAWRLWGGAWARSRLAAQADMPDGWDDASHGSRRTFEQWVGALPGLRRKR
jgi:nucleoside-diphosphate-sugar epimerase